MPGPEQNKSHNQQIEEVRKNTQPPFQPTDYTGLKLDNELAEQIKGQPVSEYLIFEKGKDKTRIQAKLPEMGYDPKTGHEYNIRVNMNYLARGMVRAVMNPDGSIDTDKAMDLSILKDSINNSATPEEYERSSKAFIDKLNIPEADRAEFETFFRVNVDPLHSDPHEQAETGSALFHGFNDPVNFMYNEVYSNFAPYQYAAEGNMPTGFGADKATKEGVGAVVKDSEADYRNVCETYRLMADMDPKTEKRILYPMDCKAFRNVTETFVRQNNAWRKQNGLEQVNMQPGDLSFAQQQEDPKNNVTRAFDEHHYLSFPVKLDGKDAVLSLENTAPPDGKIIERPGVERTGVGLFESREAIDKFHESVNLGVVKNRADYNAIKDMNNKLNNQHYNFAPQANTWEREAFHAKELAKYGNDQQVLDCFARHLVAQSVVESADAAHRPSYDKKLLDKSVEELKQNKSFKLMTQAYGVEKMREALASQDPQAASVAMYAPQQGKRYALSDRTRERLNAMGKAMNTKGHSPEWVKLHDALTDPNMKDTSQIFDAVEAYTKGKKSVRKTQEGRESFNLAMTALAIAAGGGDPVAKQRAQNLVDRINEVRGSQDAKHKNHVSLDAYAPREANEKQQQEMQQPTSQNAGREAGG